MEKVGSWAWLQENGGRLTTRDRTVLVAQAQRAALLAGSDAAVADAASAMSLDDLLPPQSPVCKAAESLCADASPAYLFNHCVRAYYWARLLGGAADFDDEALYVALMLHDLGLTDRWRITDETAHCFTMPAARAARDLAIEHGWSDARVTDVADAIALHLNILVDEEDGRVAQLVRLGSGADIVGQGISRLDRTQVDQITTRHPRADLKVCVHRDLAREVRERPESRIAFLFEHAGFEGRLKSAPFSE